MTPINAMNTVSENHVNFLNNSIFSIRVRIFAPPKAEANMVVTCPLSNSDDA